MAICPMLEVLPCESQQAGLQCRAMIDLILLTLYGCCALLLALYTLGQGVLLWQYWNHRNATPKPISYPDVTLPEITIQLPIYNEKHVVARLLDAIVALDYPADRLHIQILDDSDDATTQYIAQQIRLYPHYRIDHIRRSDRSGYKAGALAYGLAQTNALFVAIFDADFIPPSDFLRSTVPYLLADDRLCVVQTRWGHLNRDANWLTRAQALSVDAHFMVEQTGRNRAGWPIPFNGTGGVWRTAAIHDAGGWSAATLTEDLDLSFRAQLRGWQSLFLPAVVVPGELPPQLAAYRQQQQRWAKGNAQNLRRLLRPVWRSDWRLSAKLMATQHLLQYLPHPLMVILLLLTPLLILNGGLSALPLAPLGIISLIPPIMYVSSQRIANPENTWHNLLAFPALLLIGTSMMGHNSHAFITGLFERGGTFSRTPKFAQAWQGSAYALRAGSAVLLDALLLLYALWAVWAAWTNAHHALLPYLLIYAASFGTAVVWQLNEQWQLHRQKPQQSHHSQPDQHPV